MKRRTLIYVAVATLLGSACVAPRVSEIDFTAGVGQPASQVAQWGLGNVIVEVSNELTVTDKPSRRYPPVTELVWYGDPPGDRKAQVIALMSDAVRAGTVDALAGEAPVQLKLNITEFHAMTPRARSSQLQLGVHEIKFDIAILDEAGNVIASEDGARADCRRSAALRRFRQSSSARDKRSASIIASLR